MSFTAHDKLHLTSTSGEQASNTFIGQFRPILSVLFVVNFSRLFEGDPDSTC